MSFSQIALLLVGVWLLLHGLSVHVTNTLTLIFAIAILILAVVELFGVQVPTRPARTP